MLILLDIITIYLKMRDALKEQSRIFNTYEKSKKELLDAEKDRKTNELIDQGID